MCGCVVIHFVHFVPLTAICVLMVAFERYVPHIQPLYRFKLYMRLCVSYFYLELSLPRQTTLKGGGGTVRLFCC